MELQSGFCYFYFIACRIFPLCCITRDLMCICVLIEFFVYSTSVVRSMNEKMNGSVYYKIVLLLSITKVLKLYLNFENSVLIFRSSVDLI